MLRITRKVDVMTLACFTAKCYQSGDVAKRMTLLVRALLRVGGGLHLHLKQRFEGAIDPGKSQV
jgi:hypothetical protein